MKRLMRSVKKRKRGNPIRRICARSIAMEIRFRDQSERDEEEEEEK